MRDLTASQTEPVVLGIAPDEKPQQDVGSLLSAYQYQYTLTLGKRIRRGVVGAIHRGTIPGRPGYGYRDYYGPGPSTKTRKIDTVEAQIIRRIFQDYSFGSSPGEIARSLNELGIPGPSGKGWRPSTILGAALRQTGILRNSVYRGQVIWGKSESRFDPITGRRLVRRASPAAHEVIDVPHLRIVDDALWHAAQLRLTAVRSPSMADAPAKAGRST